FMPYRAVFDLMPGGRALRATNRAWMIGLLGLGLLAGMGAAAIARAWPDRRRAAAVVAVIAVAAGVGEGYRDWNGTLVGVRRRPAVPGARALSGYGPRMPGSPEAAATPRTLVIIPAYNEEAALPGVLADLARCCPDLDVLVVDDGSRDRTAEVGRAAGVLVAPLPYNLGIGGALRTGFRYALRAG